MPKIILVILGFLSPDIFESKFYIPYAFFQSKSRAGILAHLYFGGPILDRLRGQGGFIRDHKALLPYLARACLPKKLACFLCPPTLCGNPTFSFYSFFSRRCSLIYPWFIPGSPPGLFIEFWQLIF